MEFSKDKIRRLVRQQYAKVAQSAASKGSGNCYTGFSDLEDISTMSKKLGYGDEQIAFGLGETNFGRGCGNPLTLADLKHGESVLDLGSVT